MRKTATSALLLAVILLPLACCSEKTSDNKAKAGVSKAEHQLTQEEKFAELFRKAAEANSKEQLNLLLQYRRDKSDLKDGPARIVLAQEIATPSNAGQFWVKIGISDDRSVTIYANPTTIIRNTNLVKIWWLTDFKEARQLGTDKLYSSMTLNYEFACKEAKSRTLALYSFAGNMGSGSVIHNENFESQEWSEVPTESVYEMVRKFACEQK